MDLKAKYLLEACSEPIGFLNQLRQTTEPIGGGTVYSEDGELVEYDVAVEAIKKATYAFIEKACEYFHRCIEDTKVIDDYRDTLVPGIQASYTSVEEFIEDFKNYIKGKKL